MEESKAISAKKDYLVEYYQAVLTNGTYEKTGEALSSVKEPGHYKICLTGIGNYSGQREVDLYVNDTKTTAVSKLKISKISTQNYNGNKICPKPEIKYKNDVLVEDVHYTLTYYNNLEIGTASVVIQGIEENGYSGTKRLNFAITVGFLQQENLRLCHRISLKWIL